VTEAGWPGSKAEREGTFKEVRMAAKKPMMKSRKASAGSELIISKSRTKAASKRCNVSSDFYGALDKKVREMIADAEQRALNNKRKTLKPADL
jgi:hypothetical protein